ncbi:hypothetical protein J4457_00400 [Candidatus Woesearchaeota archaeon]|nr:hypothetical protein [Candidatus Woesearchaeota archaeon]
MNARTSILNHVNRAEQLLRVVYPLAKEPRVLLDAIKELNKTIPFIIQCRPTKEDAVKLEEIRMILDKHDRAAVEFVRDKKLVMCNDVYTTTKLDTKKVDELIEVCKKYGHA